MTVEPTFVEIFEAQASHKPQAIAVVSEDQQLTYAQLNHRANQSANFLRQMGVGPGTLVGVYMKRSTELIVALVGVMKAGAAFVPIAASLPPARIAYIIEDCDTPLILTQDGLDNSVPPCGAKVVCLDRTWNALASDQTPPKEDLASTKDLAYIIYTSGSTGQPKGVMVEHGSLINYLLWADEQYMHDGPHDLPLFSSIAADLTITSLLLPLISGSKIVVYREPQDGVDLSIINVFNDDAVDIIKLTPSHLAILLEQSLLPSRLKKLIVGGEDFKAGLAQRISGLFDDKIEIFNEYGPTEATVGCMIYRYDPNLNKDHSVPIGGPINNTTIHILDPELNPVSVGVTGDMYVAGKGLARGYLNQPELTAEKFIPDPFNPRTDARLYRTGDLARYLSDGNILYLGRVDHQVKIRGHRIEPGEIEAILSQHSTIREVVVVAQEFNHGDKRLAAYVVPNPEQSVSIGQLRDYLSEKLPEFMIPASFTMLDKMPLTTNGKVDRKALPVPVLNRSVLGSDFRAPRNTTEEALANIWAQVIGLERVGIHDNFFELGGDSILSIQITSKANQIGLCLTPDQLFQYPTIAQLAGIANTSPTIQAEQGVVTGTLPLTPIQHWFFEQNLIEYQHWNQAFLLKTSYALDATLLEKAVHHLLIHHDALRLRFKYENSKYRQVIVPPDAVIPVSTINLAGLTKVEQKEAIQSAATALQASLDLSEGPLMSVALFEFGSHEFNYLLIIIHHLAVDGVSWRILLDHLEVLYNQLSHNQVIQLPPKTTAYKKWAHQLTHYAQSDELQQELPFWLAKDATPPSPLPVDYPLGIDNNTVASANVISVSLNVEETTTLLKQVPKAYNTQINDVLLTALAQAVTQWTKTSTLLVNLEGHGREAILEDIDLTRTVGWFTSIFPVLLRLENTSDQGEMLMAVKEQLRRIPNRGIGYGLLRYLHKDKEIVNRLRRLPQAELSFNYLGQFDQILSPTSPFILTNEPCGPTRSLQGNRRHLLEIEGIVIDEQLRFTWNYSQNIHRQTTIEQLAQCFMDALKALIRHCQSPAAGGFTPSDFPEADLSQDELDDLMSEISEL